MKRTSYDAVVDREIALWPGVSARREKRGKHYALILSFENRERFVVYPATPSDNRGALNCCETVRTVLLEPGASRDLPERSERPLGRPRRVRALSMPRPRCDAPTRLSRDPWAVLSAWGRG